jgi:hypothetical protein
MSFPTYAAAVVSLREFAPYLRKVHTIVKFYSETHPRSQRVIARRI